MEKHVNVVAILYIVYSILGILSVFSVHLLFGVLQTFTNGSIGHNMFPTVLVQALTIPLIMASILGLVGGIGLLQFKSWARILLIVLSILNLLTFPLGTALGVYSLWVLLQSKTSVLFNRGVGPTDSGLRA